MSESERLRGLHDELDALRLANAALEAQMIAAAEISDRMLRELEAQRNALRDAHQREHALATFTQRVMDTVACVVVVLGPDGRVRQENRYAQEHLAAERGSLEGCALDDLLHPEERDALACQQPVLPWSAQSALFETVRQQGIYGAEHRFLVKDKSYQHFLVNATMLYGHQGTEEGAVINAINITTLKEQELRLRVNEARLNEAQQVARLGSWELDLRTNALTWSAEVFRIVEIDPACSDASFDLLRVAIHPEDRETVERAYMTPLVARHPRELVHRLLFHDGRTKWVSERWITHYDDDGKAVRALGTMQDITAQRQAEEDIRLSASVFENSLNGVLITRPDGSIYKVNRAFTEITGYSEAEVIGKTPRVLTSGNHDNAFYRGMWESLQRDGKWEGEMQNRHKEGRMMVIWQSASAVRNAKGEITHYIGIFYDISEQKASAERVYRLAHYDVLTGLPNRALLLDRCERALTRARREGSRFAVLFLDLDRFKHINDSLGHPVGDELLRAVAKRIQQSLREEDTVARIGGDEFVVLVENIETNHDAVVIADKLLDAFISPLELRAHTLSVGTTIGASVYPDHGHDVTSLIKNADLALYQAKENGRGCFRFYETQLTEFATERMGLENDLRQAMQRHELKVHYQPFYKLDDGRIIGVEALLRWHHPERGIVFPDTFIPIAEDTGLIITLGHWVLEQACRQARAWLDAGFRLDTIAVNLSGIQLQRGNIVAAVGRVLEDTGLPSRCLELEITETYIMRHVERDIRELEALHALGVRLAIDDFGTGQSSLSYLRRLPVSKLKIDRSFVADLAHPGASASITRAILGLGRELQMTVVAEGVETPEQETWLRTLHCDQVQGFRYSRAVEAEALTALLKESRDGMPASPKSAG
ncbi:MAG TPA: EAL domain-containing protein [Noviherbaspirillum sp.]|uniref:EAL domain-containing protein n=1 Tax=Noviherbaspirillum sp. TaxID=1926288 RepID=UPI002B4942D1|nr:EAL domain-containing protein [Noviherbaspirillum sp.]HJV84599.1 EAL domain-containing protein [Noviherbaspirillum sp.]